MLRPLDYVVQVGAPTGDAPAMLHFVYTDDGLYVPSVIRTPPGAGPFPAVLSIHGGSGGLGVGYLVDHVLERGWLFDRLLAEGYVVACGEGRMEHEDAYGTQRSPTLLDHLDVVRVFRYLQSLPFVDSSRVAIFGVSHGGEIQLKATSEMGGGPAALVPGEPAVIEYLGLRYTGPRKESNLQFRGAVSDDQIDLARAQERIDRLPRDLPILILGREDDHLQGLFRKLYELLQRAGCRVEWASWDHPEHAYQWGPRRTPDGYHPDAIQQATVERVVSFLNEHLQPRAPGLA